MAELTGGPASADISYVAGRRKFNYRVCGIRIDNNRVLAMHDERSPRSVSTTSALCESAVAACGRWEAFR